MVKKEFCLGYQGDMPPKPNSPDVVPKELENGGRKKRSMTARNAVGRSGGEGLELFASPVDPGGLGGGFAAFGRGCLICAPINTALAWGPDCLLPPAFGTPC
jgi:hypothetical protein